MKDETRPKLVPICSYCNGNNVKLRRQIAANSRVDFMWYCLTCDRPAVKGKPFLAKSQIEAWQQSGKLKNIDAVPIVNDYSVSIVCEVCGKNGAELNHWLPQAFSGMVDNFLDWPTGYLCKGCHDIWHELVTPYLPGRGATDLSHRAHNRF